MYGAGSSKTPEFDVRPMILVFTQSNFLVECAAIKKRQRKGYSPPVANDQIFTSTNDTADQHIHLNRPHKLDTLSP